jgi:hypothetical protein
VLRGVDSCDERLGDAGVGAVEVGVVGDVGFLADLEGARCSPWWSMSRWMNVQ